MNTLNIRKYKAYFVSSILMTIAAVLMAQKLDFNPSFDGFMIGFCSSISAFFLIRLIRHLKHPTLAETEAIEKNDERNVMVNGKASFVFSKGVMILLTFQLVLYYFLDLQIPLIVSFVMLAIAMTALSALKNYYERRL